MRKLLFILVVLVAGFGLNSCMKMNPKYVVADQFDELKNDDEKLRSFFEKMPKGGELHHHAIGSIFAEDLIDIAVEHGCYINPRTLEVYKDENQAINQVVPDTESLPIAIFLDQYPGNRDRIIDAWSIRNYKAQGKNGHDWFFASFNKFKEAFFADIPRCLSILTKQAQKENVQYLETMLAVPEVTAKALQLSTSIQDSFKWPDLEKYEQWLIQLNEAGMMKLAKENVDSFKAYYSRTFVPKEVKLKFMAYGLRIYPDQRMTFAEMALNFATAKRSNLVVGVNFVAPEDHPLALENYNEHMKMFRFFRQEYPTVKVSLHAGELTPDLPGVDSTALQTHITEAIRAAGANRIGHGVCIDEDRGKRMAYELLARGRAVELNLRSNEVILQTDSSTHPLRSYLENYVAVCLSTDDAGILRTNLAEQYFLAVKYHPQLGYLDMVDIARASIKYSFLSKKEKQQELDKFDLRITKFEEEMAN